MFFKSNKKNSTVNIDATLASKIPYAGCYEEEGIIESIPGKFSKMYMVEALMVTLRTLPMCMCLVVR